MVFQAWNNLITINSCASKHNWVEELWKTVSKTQGSSWEIPTKCCLDWWPGLQLYNFYRSCHNITVIKLPTEREEDRSLWTVNNYLFYLLLPSPGEKESIYVHFCSVLIMLFHWLLGTWELNRGCLTYCLVPPCFSWFFNFCKWTVKQIVKWFPSFSCLIVQSRESAQDLTVSSTRLHCK